VAAFLPGISPGDRDVLSAKLETALRAAGLAKQVRTAQGQSFLLVDLETSASRADLEKFLADFTRTVNGTDQELFHPDFTKAILLMGDEDPLPQIRGSAPPRTVIARLNCSRAISKTNSSRSRASAKSPRSPSWRKRFISCSRTPISPATA